MAKNSKSKNTAKTVETLTHEADKRKNIPTAELQAVVEQKQQHPIRVAYQRRNRDLDPQLVWRGKDEQDWSDLVVQVPPLYIQEKVHPKALIDDLLAFSRIGRAETKKTAVDLKQLVQEVLAEIGQDTKGRDIAWKVGALPVCYGDRSMLRLVVVNLVSNAAKFTRMRKRAEIEIGCVDRDENEVEVFVRDNGAGFDMQYVDKLFGVFQRLHLSEQFEGTGIGLATVQRIIHRHGGQVRGEGTLDQGATFYFTLPKAQHAGERTANAS